MKIGYARVSTDEQNFDLQRAGLEGAGYDRVSSSSASMMMLCTTYSPREMM